MIAVVLVAVAGIVAVVDVKHLLVSMRIVLLLHALVDARQPALHDVQEREKKAENGMEAA